MVEARARTLIDLTAKQRRTLLKKLSDADLETLRHDWFFWALDGQIAPEGAWRVWLMMAGRGFGKTRAGSEWIRSLAKARPGIRIALIGATMAEARAVMIEGESGLIAVSSPGDMPHWAPSRGVVTWPNGAQAFVYSGENPEKLRGPQHDYAWCDEIAKWAHPQGCWDNLQLGLRLGDAPKTLVTTTPRPIPLMATLLRIADHAVTRGATPDNFALPAAYVAAMIDDYGGTRTGRQEIDGELLTDVVGALWTRDIIEHVRVAVAPAIRRVVIGVDPPAGTLSGKGGDACGIIAVAIGDNGFAYVIEDNSVADASPEGWARAVAACAARVGADKIVAEANNGGRMVESVLRGAAINMPVKLVHASHGKVARAEPVAALYTSGRAFHVGGFLALEDEMCGLIIGGNYVGPGRSPDRADALVWAMTELMLGKEAGTPRVRGF